VGVVPRGTKTILQHIQCVKSGICPCLYEAGHFFDPPPSKNSPPGRGETYTSRAPRLPDHEHRAPDRGRRAPAVGARATDHEHRPSTTTTDHRSALEHHGQRITTRGSRPPDHIQTTTDHGAGRDPLAPSLTGDQPRRASLRPTLAIEIAHHQAELEITYQLAPTRHTWSTLNSTTSTRSPKRKGATWAPSLAR